MKKKILTVLGLGAVVVATLPLFAAFEAHVINVTARIENALSVPLEHLGFGTVFPQEELDKRLDISLSQSFLEEDRVDDVDYIIRQKPKCGITSQNGTVLDESSTATGHVVLDAEGKPVHPEGTDDLVIDCGNPPRALQEGETWGVLPLLCPYLSKHPIRTEEDSSQNDGVLDAFHPIGFADEQTGVWVWNDVKGHLAKSQQDTVDNWNIDLKVPCFGGHCAQDWEEFVRRINPSASSTAFIQPLENEHKVFGCDLWVEVTGVSLRGGLGCREQADIMLVLDRSGSIGSDADTMKNAAKAFVDALALDGVHAGLASFSSSATLDEHLTNVAQDLKDAIDALVIGGTTDLEDGILTANGELANPGDGHDRPDGTSPDFMVIITDGQPNVCNGGGCDPEDAAAAAADAARAAGIEVFVVGVGAGVDEDYLKTEIADDASHYFSAANFDDLENILKGIAACEE